ncbi:MAG: DUF1801 domain-containing protein [Myxococcota bacterium]
MANKTLPTDVPVEDFLRTVAPLRLDDARELLQMITEVSGCPPVMWGPSIVGFGHVNMKYESGRELEWMLVGFSPRKREQVLYITPGFDEYGPLLEKLGPHRSGGSCLYIKKLDQVDRGVLRELLEVTVQQMRAQYESVNA